MSGVAAMALALSLGGAVFDAVRSDPGVPSRWAGHLFAAVVVVVLAVRRPEDDAFNARVLFATPRPGWARWSKVGLWALAAVGVAVAIELLLLDLFGRPGWVAARLQIVDGARIVESLVFAPLLEEVVFRLAIGGVLADAFGTRTGVLGSFLVFAVIHSLRGNLDVTNLFAGLLFGWVFLTSRSLVVPVIFHALGNLLALSVQLVWAALLGYPVARALLSWKYHP
jgi:membrane protease YdiL (CAAX protease family)